VSSRFRTSATHSASSRARRSSPRPKAIIRHRAGWGRAAPSYDGAASADANDFVMAAKIDRLASEDRPELEAEMLAHRWDRAPTRPARCPRAILLNAGNSELFGEVFGLLVEPRDDRPSAVDCPGSA
jgi:hypothetical protein